MAERVGRALSTAWSLGGSSAIGLLFKRRQWAAHSGRAVTVVVGLLAHDHAEVVMAARALSGYIPGHGGRRHIAAATGESN